MAVPKLEELFNPLLQALKNLGGSGNNGEIVEEVAKVLSLSDEDIQKPHTKYETKLSYRIAWAKTYLKHVGLLSNSSRAVWSLTSKGFNTESISPKEVVDTVRATGNSKTEAKNKGEETTPHDTDDRTELDQKVIERLKSLSPEGFERFCQRLLREAGFIEVEVTGRSGDGGIDGVGVIRLNLISFRVFFQCKKYDKSVSPAQVRELKGAMDGRAGRGLLITTGAFTRQAEEEARRFGEKQIDLIDGLELASLMREFKLGLKEELLIDQDFFETYSQK
jgi:restriction system protein